MYTPVFAWQLLLLPYGIGYIDSRSWAIVSGFHKQGAGCSLVSNLVHFFRALLVGSRTLCLFGRLLEMDELGLFLAGWCRTRSGFSPVRGRSVRSLKQTLGFGR